MAEVWFEFIANTRFRRVRRVAEIGSTNAELMEQAKQGSAEGEVLIADFQSAGRGRRGRNWLAPPGTALMMSVLLRPPAGLLAASQASLVVSAWACAAIQACESETGVSPKLKWPNDLVILPPAGDDTASSAGGAATSSAGGAAGNPPKLAGILAESLVDDGAITALVIGMGLNTGWSEIPPELAGPDLANTATSLNLECGHKVDRAALAAKLLLAFEQRYEALIAGASSDGAHSGGASSDANSGGTEATLAEVRQQCCTLGSRVRVQREPAAGGTIYGIAVDINSDGTLLVVDDSAQQHRISSGEVVHLRPVR